MLVCIFLRQAQMIFFKETKLCMYFLFILQINLIKMYVDLSVDAELSSLPPSPLPSFFLWSFVYEPKTEIHEAVIGHMVFYPSPFVCRSWGFLPILISFCLEDFLSSGCEFSSFFLFLPLAETELRSRSDTTVNWNSNVIVSFLGISVRRGMCRFGLKGRWDRKWGHTALWGHSTAA